jgi:glycopeptide antibiotics resistance protein
MLGASVVGLAGGAAAIGLLALRRPWRWTVVAVVGVAHVVILATVAFFPIPVDRAGAGATAGSPFSWDALNLVPFSTIGRALSRGGTGELRIAILNLFVLFPAGVYLPILFARARTRRAMVAIAVVGGASVELVQLAISLALSFLYRAVDIDDVILNAAGLGLGLVVGKVVVGRSGRLS